MSREHDRKDEVHPIERWLAGLEPYTRNLRDICEVEGLVQRLVAPFSRGPCRGIRLGWYVPLGLRALRVLSLGHPGLAHGAF